MSETEVLSYIGVTGLPGSGKGAFVDELRRQLAAEDVGLRYWSLSDELRDEARQRGLAVSRPVLRSVANELREAHGSGVLAQRVAEKAETSMRAEADAGPIVVIIDSIRNPEEVRTLRRRLQGAFHLVAVEAPIEVLIGRIAARARDDEAREVVQQEQQARKMILGESGQNEPAHGHNINQCIAMADSRVDNSGTLDDLAIHTAQFLAKLLSIMQRES